MLRKSTLAAQGRLTEPSVVETPRAKLYAGVPNALFGVVYYPMVAAVSWFATALWLLWLLIAAAVLAAATSAYLAYSLLYVTRRSCAYCWTAHLINWGLLVTVPWLIVLRHGHSQ